MKRMLLFLSLSSPVLAAPSTPDLGTNIFWLILVPAGAIGLVLWALLRKGRDRPRGRGPGYPEQD